MTGIEGCTVSEFKVSTVRCAGPHCDAVRGEVNRWFIVGFVEGVFCCRAFDGEMRPEDLPVCGQQCAQRLFEQWLNRR